MHTGIADYDGAHDFNNQRALALLRSSFAGSSASAPAIVATLVGMAATIGMGHRYGNDAAAAASKAASEASDPSQTSAALKQCIDARTPDAVDYSIVDAAVVPIESAAAMHSEALWVVAGCYMPEDPGQAMGAWTRRPDRIDGVHRPPSLLAPSVQPRPPLVHCSRQQAGQRRWRLRASRRRIWRLRCRRSLRAATSPFLAPAVLPGPAALQWEGSPTRRAVPTAAALRGACVAIGLPSARPCDLRRD